MATQKPFLVRWDYNTEK